MHSVIDESKELDLDDHFFGIFGGNGSGILSKSVINEMIKMATLYLDDSQFGVLRCRRHFSWLSNIRQTKKYCLQQDICAIAAK
ncbi:hypothetical protein [Aquimarina litoralis]|uniref:hypothetical protein n=1 Tax=Aquimarina litoralis TaxID=584605 RepID=UPI0031E3DC8E